MTLLTFRSVSAPLSSFRRQEAVARTLTDRNTYTKMVEDEALEVLRGGTKFRV